MEPHNELAVGGLCLALPGEAYVFYLEGKDLVINVPALEGGGPVTADWYDTWTGYREKAASIRPPVMKLKKPDSLGDAPGVLVIRRQQ